MVKEVQDDKNHRRCSTVLKATNRIPEQHANPTRSDHTNNTRRAHVRLETIKRIRDPQRCDLWNDAVYNFFEPSCEEGGITLRRQLDPGLPQLLMDRELLKQALLNLFTNARQAMPDGGELMVRTWFPGDRVRIDVIDTGEGIPRHLLQSIWQVYFSTKDSGTGLGLPTVRRIVADHGGETHVQSEPGQGTCFTILLPLPPSLSGSEPLRLPGSATADGTDLATVLAPPEEGDDEGDSP